MDTAPPTAEELFRAEEIALADLIGQIKAHALAKRDLPWPSSNDGRMYQAALVRAQRALGDAIQCCGFALADLNLAAMGMAEDLGERV